MNCRNFHPDKYEQFLREDVGNKKRKVGEPPQAFEYYLHVDSCAGCSQLFSLYTSTNLKFGDLITMQRGLEINKSFLEALTG
ncbi:MAG: hypothetical protein AABY10_04540 [Nanoarchaeota archaeon]